MTSDPGRSRSAPAFLLSLLLLAGAGSCAPDPPARRLDPGSAIHPPGIGPEGHTYLIELAKDQAFQLAVDQRGVDVVTEILGPEGKTSLEMDAPTGSFSLEPVCFVADRSGTYRIHIRALAEASHGTYSLRLDSLRTATDSDRACLEASRAWSTAEARWQAAEKSGDLGPELLADYAEALKLWERAGRPFEASFTLAQSGRRWSELGYVARAASCYEQALGRVRALGDRRQELVLLNRLGDSLRLLGELKRADSSLAAALRSARRLQDRGAEATALNNLALVARTRGEVRGAIADYRRAADLYRSLEEPAAEAVALFNLGVSYSFLGQFPAALDVLGDALAIQERLRRPADEARTLTAIGWVHHLEGRPDAALGYFRQAVRLSRSSGHRPEEAAALDRMGTVYRGLGRFPEALGAYRQALAIAEERSGLRDMAHTLANLGELLEDQKRPREAQVRWARSLRLFRKLGDREGLAHTLAGLARAERALGDLGSARRHLEEALTLVDGLRALALGEGARPEPDPFWQEFVGQYVDLLMELDRHDRDGGHARRAFEVADRARAQSLLALLRDSELGLRSGVPAPLLSRERELRERLNAVYEQRLAGLDPPAEETARLDRALRELEIEHEEVRRQIRLSNPGLSALREPRPVTVGEIQRRLEPGTLLMSYALGRERSFLFLLGPHSFESYPLPGRGQIEEVAEALYQSLQNRRRSSQGRLAAAKLGEMLLAPLAQKTALSRLLVVPDGRLHYIPFGALPLPTGTEIEKRPLLLEAHEVAYLPSATTFLALRERNAKRPRTAEACLAVMADPVFSTDEERLPFSRQEAEAILALVPEKQRRPALGDRATLGFIRSGGLDRCRVLHFATHALLDEEHPELSGITLSQLDEQGRPIEGWLRLQEIYTLHLAADVVVLSACRTALGKQVRGQGMAGLTQGFFYAGASRLVVSLWDVDDQATSRLMERFYRGVLQEGLAPAAALRQAQLWLRSQDPWQSPFFWSPFVLQGDPTPPFPDFAQTF